MGSFNGLFSTLMESRASSFLMVHNHPSGSVMPSKADLFFTWKVSSRCIDLGIDLIDHFIVADRSLLSMRRAGLL
ncbi:JAB domain-containing protein [Altererythrobacter sp. GH1-8]|uniref:JAB domain-containing protein n=1 Tax=Altererythrobacter sp. GH1-8 TaxID=3349333 RepID=UPI00374DE2B2